MIKVFNFLCIFAICNARPGTDLKNVVTVPPNCPEGQEWVNGQCRDVWFKTLEENNLGELELNEEIDMKNIVTVPPNCPPGQQWINGACRDVWRSDANTKNVITVPNNCPAGQEYINGQCRDVWRSSPNLMENNINNLQNLLSRREREEENQDDPNRNVINVPNQCPIGYRPDALGICRPIF